jgi:hypothetical protein
VLTLVACPCLAMKVVGFYALLLATLYSICSAYVLLSRSANSPKGLTLRRQPLLLQSDDSPPNDDSFFPTQDTVDYPALQHIDPEFAKFLAKRYTPYEDLDDGEELEDEIPTDFFWNTVNEYHSLKNQGLTQKNMIEQEDHGVQFDDPDILKIFDRLFHPENDQSIEPVSLRLNAERELPEGSLLKKIEPDFLNELWEVLLHTTQY